MDGTVNLTLAHLRAIAAAQGLDMDDARLERLLPLVQALWDGVAALDELDLERTEPDLVFRARWEDGDAPGG